MRSAALDWHPFNHFATGNLETLNKPDIYDEVRAFYDSKYSSNLMTVVVYGREDVAILERWVRQSFSEVVNKELKSEFDMRIPFDHTVMGRVTRVIPVQDVKHIRFFWSLPPMIEHYKVKPGNYISHLIGHEGKNSLLSFLKAEGLAQELSASSHGNQYTNFSFLIVNVELTDKGLEHYERVAEIMHAYIDMLKHKGAQEWIQDEVKAIHQADFNFKSKSDPFGYAENLAWRLHRYPADKIITANDLIEEFDADLIMSYINQLTPQNLNIYMLSKKFDKSEMQTERWYGTQYRVDNFTAELLHKITNPEVSHSKLVLDLPQRNEFLPTEFVVLPLGTEALPTKILDDDKNTVWFKQDDTFKVDKVLAQLMIFCNDAGFQDSPYFHLLAKLWKKIFWDKFREENYLADQAGLKLDMSLESYGLKFSLSGFSQKFDKFFENVLGWLAGVTIDIDDREKFQNYFTSLNESLSNHFYSAPTNQAIKLGIDVSLINGHFSEIDQLKALQGITFEDLLWFSQKWLKTVRFEWFVMGNISKERTLEMVEASTRTFEQTKSCSYISKDDYPRLQVVEIPMSQCQASASNLYYPAYLLDKTNNNSVAIANWQFAAETAYLQAGFALLDTYVKEPCFDVLRTKEQLGYIVSSYIRKLRGVLHLNILIQSSVAAPYHLTERISSFIDNLRSEIREISDEKFNTTRESALKTLAKKDVSIFEEFRRFILEVDSAAYWFSRREDVELELKRLPKEAFQHLYEDLFYSQCRRLDIELISENYRESQETSGPKSRSAVKTPNEFKKQMSILPQVYIRK